MGLRQMCSISSAIEEPHQRVRVQLQPQVNIYWPMSGRGVNADL